MIFLFPEMTYKTLYYPQAHTSYLDLQSQTKYASGSKAVITESVKSTSYSIHFDLMGTQWNLKFCSIQLTLMIHVDYLLS